MQLDLYNIGTSHNSRPVEYSVGSKVRSNDSSNLTQEHKNIVDKHGPKSLSEVSALFTLVETNCLNEASLNIHRYAYIIWESILRSALLHSQSMTMDRIRSPAIYVPWKMLEFSVLTLRLQQMHTHQQEH